MVYKIADLIAEIPTTDGLAVRCQDYRHDEAVEPDIVVREELYRPHLYSAGAKPETIAYMEAAAQFYRQLLDYNGFYLHSSAVVRDGKAYLFSAPSGTGKSTHTEKWCRLFGAQLLNDDKPVLRLQDGVWTAYGTPWSGKYDLSIPTGVPLGAIAFLRRGDENTIRRMEPGEAVTHMISQAPRYLNAEQMIRQLNLLDTMLKTIPVYLLTCRNDDEAAMVSSQAMRYGL